MYFNYKDYLKKFSQENRICPTKAEGLFWNCILNRDRTGYRFLRQKPIEGYILDFYCAKLKLGIEIDGESHEGRGDYDEERDLILLGLGIKIVRYSNTDVLKIFEGVHLDVEFQIKEREKEMNL
ncbi:MAG: endonuclease domain-containing protein [Candidatus Absconditabacterales bacterium]